ncbi:LAETG motif-containing sortase-dependent surface protein [Streptomyces sp. NPDC005899]|uniref:LAETG motif-containing sortase-dependent surface protein n=1 Tax=Streptomyces sp. NPDC005899 TaxID=3155716 RepID=UPI00340E91BC
MKKHLSSRFAVRSSVVAASLLLSVVAPVAVAGTAAAQPSGTFTGVSSAAAPRIDSVRPAEAFTFGERVRIVARITNPSDQQINGDQQTTVSFAHGRQVDAGLGIIPADSSQVVLEQRGADGIRRVPLGRAADGSLQALVTIGKGKPIPAGATVTEDFYLTVDPSVPAGVTLGEFSLGSDTEATGRRSTSFPMKRDSVADKVAVTGLDGRPELVTGGAPVEFGVTVTKGSAVAKGSANFFFVYTPNSDLDPQHVTVERRDAAGVWVAVKTGKQDQSVLGDMGDGAMEAGETRTYDLRLSLTRNFPAGARSGTFTMDTGNATASFGFDVRHEGGSAPAPDVDRELAVSFGGVQGVTPLRAAGAAEEFTATVRNKGGVPQSPHVLLEITDRDVERRMAAGEVRLEQYSGKGWTTSALAPSEEGGHLMARITPGLPTLAPGAAVTYRLRIAATSAMKARAFDLDVEARAELSSTRRRLAFGVESGATPVAASSTAAVPVSADGSAEEPAAPVADGRMAETGGGDSTPLLLGSAGALLALGAAGLLIARRRAL